MLQKEMIIIYCENHIDHMTAFCKQNAVLFSVKTSRTHRPHCALKGYIGHEDERWTEVSQNLGQRRALVLTVLNFCSQSYLTKYER
jgi:hypothetical protein